MGAVFVTSQQDGCCFVLAPCAVNILQQTQLQVAHWLSHGSWAGLQGPINGDINKEGWGQKPELYLKVELVLSLFGGGGNRG